MILVTATLCHNHLLTPPHSLAPSPTHMVHTLLSQIKVISGTSGGSICAAMCACKTEAELLADVCVDDVSTDFQHGGGMRRRGIAWFPPLWKQMGHFMRTGFLVDNKEYMATCYFYYGTVTFAEVMQRGGDD